MISGLLRGNFWQPLISPEAQKERSCQFFSASHIGPRANCPFHRPTFFRPACMANACAYALVKTSLYNYPFRRAKWLTLISGFCRTERVKCLALERSTKSPARARTWTTRSGIKRTSNQPTAPSSSRSNCQLQV